MGDKGFRILQALFSLFWHCDVQDLKNTTAGGPAVFVANHLGSFAPVALVASFPVRLYPWVEHDVVDWKLCPGYLRTSFVESELHLPTMVSHALAWLISKPCVLLMRAIRAVPVHPHSMKSALTWRRSVDLLRHDKWLAVFPESQTIPFSQGMNEFQNGFAGLAPLVYRSTGKILRFYPVAVHRESRTIRIGQPFVYEPGSDLASEEERIARALETSVAAMYSTLQSAGR